MIKIPKIFQKPEYRLIPVSREKKAIETGWNTINNYQYNEKKFLDYLKKGCNYGILTGIKDLYVLDFDDMKFYNAIKTNLKPTLIVKTGKGYHYFYKYPNVRSHKIKDKNGKNLIEIFGISDKGTPQQVIGANSIHETGKIYKIVNEIEPIIQNPEFLKELLAKEVVSSFFFPFCSSSPNEKKSNNLNTSFQPSVCSKEHRFDLKLCRTPIEIKTLAVVPNLLETYKDRKILFFEYQNKFYWRDLNKTSEYSLKRKFGENPFYWTNRIVEIHATPNFHGQKNTFSLEII